ncbi:hypothetical protein FJT64_006638 [Amphibalanus amphitrite]|uniref:Uncharacterized protein n=1 Tax=Amphibalanus amphitrite TaxID=1232801 RepID=A0A6A4VHM2_AMPAM|nr:hypothetical protein FJT64_006638 [Amphibalanus amphitrite]
MSVLFTLKTGSGTELNRPSMRFMRAHIWVVGVKRFKELTDDDSQPVAESDADDEETDMMEQIQEDKEVAAISKGMMEEEESPATRVMYGEEVEARAREELESFKGDLKSRIASALAGFSNVTIVRYLGRQLCSGSQRKLGRRPGVFRHTGQLEVFHSTNNTYAPKMKFFSVKDSWRTVPLLVSQYSSLKSTARGGTAGFRATGGV